MVVLNVGLGLGCFSFALLTEEEGFSSTYQVGRRPIWLHADVQRYLVPCLLWIGRSQMCVSEASLCPHPHSRV